MTAERFIRLIAYCRIDEPAAEDRVLLEDMLNSAEAYLEQAGIPVPESGTARRAQYDMAANAMVLSMWDQRGSQSEGITLTENPAFRRQVNQLKLTAGGASSSATSSTDETPQSASLTAPLAGEP